ncbi:unnamed protein product [Calicophoron daubneyi]|uniref:5'-nucleotidase n=1 Tax=Calicophoron daubneyi TaxID=300641 RepID=A0AAV2U0T5_CALDB
MLLSGVVLYVYSLPLSLPVCPQAPCRFRYILVRIFYHGNFYGSVIQLSDNKQHFHLLEFHLARHDMIECGHSNTDAVSSVSLLHFSIQKAVDTLIKSVIHGSCETKKSKTYIRDIEETQKKLFRLIAGGSELLQVVSDFDQTMSKYWHNGALVVSCHGVIKADPELTEEAKQKLKQGDKKYLPIEFDPNLSNAEKIPFMLDWWTNAHKTIVDCKLHRDILARTVKECSVELREGLSDFMGLLQKYGIPLLIFSAGIGDVIELLLQDRSLYTENVRVISNFMEFNEDGVLVGFREPLIHTFNKSANSVANDHFAQLSSERRNVLLIGDSIGDVNMADGAVDEDPAGTSGTVLRVGFLNGLVEASLEKYQSLYDIVLVNDDTFDVPLSIVRSVVNRSSAFVDGVRTS